MKKIVAMVLLLGLIVSLSACGKVEITMQEIYDAGQTEALLKNHQSIYVQDEMDGEVYGEKYLTKEYVYDYVPGDAGEYDWAEFMTDDADYCYVDDEPARYFSVTPDGVSSGSAGDRAERYASAILSEDTLGETIESVSEKDGRITVKSVLGQKILEDMAEVGVTSGKFEYVLDAKTREIISCTSDYAFNDGTTFCVVTEVTYDAEVPEMVKALLKYDNQTEDLRNITVVSNPGAKKEISQNFQIPKGLIIGFVYDDAFADKVGFYTDVACTEPYDAYADTDSDLTIYIKWAE